MAVYIDSETSMQICNKYLASQPLIGHKLTVCATARQRFKQARLHYGRETFARLSALKTPHTRIFGTKLTHKVQLGKRTYRPENRTNPVNWVLVVG